MSEQKTAIITAAGKGMGAAIARNLADVGYNLALLSPSGSAEALAKELGGIGMSGSVTSTADLQKLVDKTMEAYGRIDAVVNHTGHPPKGPLLEIPDEDWHKGLDLVMLNVARMARLVTPIMLEQGGGAIVNISTFAVFEPEATFPVSAAMRAALAGYTKLYADEYASKGIRMNNLLPGFIESLPETEERRQRIPMKRYGTVTEVAQTVRFLLSDGAGYITGQNIRVDGGITRSI
ncbi:3-oxoacyl-[acyl-carrier protein] reductase [hydrothermal vent metagenome]|uniref:3-oxoacyl-[acyl-carrier protein] reductase n=1 Tax=hydrothermal vent metagenome TaxID=652676 RepID=A0A3B0VES6_9ZZZZ